MSDWIEWKGGDCPVNGDELGQVQLRGEVRVAAQKGEPYLLRGWRWDHRGVDGDIVAYRVVQA